jgi:hypothetical protein
MHDWSLRGIVIAGLVAGLVLLFVQVVFHWIIVGPNWWFFRGLLDPAGRIVGMARYVGIQLGSGVAIVWLYSLAALRHGKGLRAAVVVGFAYWVIGEALPALSFRPLIREEFRLQILDAMWWFANGVAFLSFVLAAYIGALVYTRRQVPSHTAVDES